MHELAFISTFPPRKCGIATFTADVVKYIEKAGQWKCRVVAIDDGIEHYDYGDQVWFHINQFNKKDYIKAARHINNSSIDAVMIEHEYGIFGGSDGQYILELTKLLDKPFALTCHTVLSSPTISQRSILKHLCRQAAAVVVMTERAGNVLSSVYDVDKDKIKVIPHGIPIFKIGMAEEIKKKYKIGGRRVISTFGLVSPGKGLEYAIRALDIVAGRFPDVVYLIMGQTHPMLKRKSGETYRESLIELVRNLSLNKHVRFINHFLSLRELSDYLAATDVYITPYPGKEQAVSGTLSYALGAGKAIVSTPYAYAVDLLADDRGILVPFNDVRAMANAICKLLADDALRHRLERRAMIYGEHMQWQAVGRNYSELMSYIASSDNINILDKEA
ncbi:glycosyltransferase family 4 protein [Mahella sp.]|uniref:glycosyltransferase family 4 protein n=1 Tax=Mahella sp. TaxID=2798721 RepID=UPI0025C48160|nr:glycosyltransferase family 4 protein [Mahella sp.]MBZ4665774.1 glycosyl transferase group 1 [Mahella sp.]